MRVVLVTGGRDYSNRERVFEQLSLFSPDLVIHGAATGADAFASQWVSAKKRGEIRYEIPCPADWKMHGKAAGPMRNSEMVELLEMFHESGCLCTVIAFPGGRGTADCVAKARRAGLFVEMIAS